MAVVMVQSGATAHVYRIFGALVALLLMMALAVGVVRVRGDRTSASPYGALAPLPSGAPSAALAAAAPIVPATHQVIAPATTPAVVSLASTDPVASPSADGARLPREIAIDKAAAGSAVPQPAPPAVVQAATRAVAAAAPPRPTEMAALAPADATPTASAPLSDAASQAGLININTASVDQMNNIPGGGHIGRSIARHRPYRSLEDLVEHRVLKARDFARIKSAITIE